MKHNILWSLMLAAVLILASHVRGEEGLGIVSPSLDPSVVSTEAPADDAAARQLRIYRDALLQGSSDEIRIDAAVGLLLQSDTASRDVLVGALKAEDNPAARITVCRALIRNRGLGRTLAGRQAFLEPLLTILQGRSADQSFLAAEALLLYDYTELEAPLRQILDNEKLDKPVRIQLIHSLQLRPEPKALEQMIRFLDDSDPEIVRAAERALQESYGIPPGTSRSVWSKMLDNPDSIRRERLLHKEMRLRELQAERDRWQRLFLVSLDRQHEQLDEAGRLRQIQEQMASDLPPLRLWALDKIGRTPVAGERLRTGLLAMLSDPVREVRLQTAKLLTNMSAIDPAERLLERFRLEKDSEVALAIFEALGEACFFGFSTGSGIELRAEIKKETLTIAAQYLQSDAAAAAKKGAEVIRKIFELNNLPEEATGEYLDMLYWRYEKAKTESGTLRADLLAIMSNLCGQGTSRAKACSLFEPLFVEALTVKDNTPLRLAAAKGLVLVDRVRALELFRRHQITADESVSVRQIVIELAGQAGTAQDLNWLLASLSHNGFGEQAWQSIKAVAQRQKATFLLEWLQNLESTPAAKVEHVREILEIAEQKALVDKDTALLGQIQQKMIVFLCSSNAWEQASAVVSKLLPEVEEGFPQEIQLDVLKIHLYSNQSEKAVSWWQSRLDESDIDAEQMSPCAAVLESYLLNEQIGMEVRLALLERIAAIENPYRPKWTAFIKDVRSRLLPDQTQAADNSNIEDPDMVQLVLPPLSLKK